MLLIAFKSNKQKGVVRMINKHLVSFILCGCILVIFAFFLTTSCSAQLLTAPFYSPFASSYPSISDFYFPYFNPFFPVGLPMSFVGASISNPILNPSLASLPMLSRNAAATLIVLPPPAPSVTAYAPLGTLNLTPSTLVFLILYLTLEE